MNHSNRFRLSSRLRALLLLFALPGASLGAQAVAVEVVGDPGLKPIPGSLVSLVGLNGTVVRRTLADESGRATLSAAAGRYRLKIDGIGYQGTTTDWVELVAGQTSKLRIVLTAAPLNLKELVVTSRQPAQCHLDADEGSLVARIWGEARKALMATQLTTSRAVVLDRITYQRDLNRLDQIVNQKADTSRAASNRPFASIDPEILHRKGYIFEEFGGYSYNAPDADLMLSEEFLDDHCFRIAPIDASSPPNAVGLAFEPNSKRSVPEVAGALWLDQQSAELKFMEFGYANWTVPYGAERVGGRIEFSKLPNGGWIVSQWHIRMPRVVNITSRPAGMEIDNRKPVGRDSLTGYREAGGSARLAGGAALSGQAIEIAGTVVDSSTGAPIDGVRVSIQADAFGSSTDSAGHYRFSAPAVGSYAVTFTHPAFELLGIQAPLRGANLERGRVAIVDLAVPLFAAASKAACPDLTRNQDAGLLIGLVIDSATAKPVANAKVSARFGTVRLVSGSQVSDRGTELETTTNESGYFRLCPLPVGKELTLSAGLVSNGKAAKVTATVPQGRVALLTMKLP